MSLKLKRTLEEEKRSFNVKEKLNSFIAETENDFMQCLISDDVVKTVRGNSSNQHLRLYASLKQLCTVKRSSPQKLDVIEMESQMETVNDDTVGEHFITDMVLGLAEDGIRDDIFRMDQPQLLDLPHEILLLIFKHLPSSSLLACVRVHSTFRDLILDSQFLDNITRQTLGLNKSDEDFRFHRLPKPLSPSMELWFLSYNEVMSTYDHSRTLMNKENFLFPLECFHHSLMTWLAQSMGASITNIDLRPNHVSNKTRRFLGDTLFTSVRSLPAYVFQPLTKFALAFPEMISKSIVTTHCSLHRGKLRHLQNVWYEAFTHEQRNAFDPHFSMEIIFGQTVEPKMSAMAILFCPKTWVVWTGAVAEFPGCKFEETWTMTCLDTHSSVCTVQNMCKGPVEAIVEHTLTHQVINNQWKRQNLFPGLCHQLHQVHRNGLVSCVLDKTSSLSHLFLALLHNKQLIKTKRRHYTKLLAQIQLHIHPHCHQNTQLCTNQTVNVASVVEAQLHSIFHSEVMDYITDHDSHQILCPTCSTLWFPSNVSVEKCVQRISNANLVPYQLWPYHTLASAYALLSESCLSLDNI